MIHKCEKCGRDAVLFRTSADPDPKILCADWHCWDVEPTNPTQIENGVDIALSETESIIREILSIFDKHAPIMDRIFAIRRIENHQVTNSMMQLLSDTMFHIYLNRWPNKVKDLRVIRSQFMPHIVACLDMSINNTIDANQKQPSVGNPAPILVEYDA
jgi:hypothetical protein